MKSIMDKEIYHLALEEIKDEVEHKRYYQAHNLVVKLIKEIENTSEIPRSEEMIK